MRPNPLETKYGSWAIVTGATSGIGLSFAHELAHRGLALVLVARTESRLRETAQDLQRKYGTRCRVLALDLSGSDAAAIVDRETQDLDVGLLVNNAGVEQRGAFLRETPALLRRASALNVTTPTELAQRFGNRFLSRRRGGIIFVSGIIGHQGVPYLAHYAATKAHQLALAEGLHYELRKHGIDVLGLSPGLTTTAMVDRLSEDIRFGRIGMLPLDPARVARAALRHLGRRPSVVVGLQYRFFAMLSKRLLSRARGAWLFGTLFRFAFSDQSLVDPRQGGTRIEAPKPSRPSRAVGARRAAGAGPASR